MVNAEKLITDNLPLWSSTIKNKKTTGRGSNKKRELYGVKKLRELILELAVRGLLVPQDPNDEPASILIEQIEIEKKRLLGLKLIKKEKSLPPIESGEIPFQIPRSWQLLRLPHSYHLIPIGKKKLKSSDINESGEFPVIDQGIEHISGYYDDESLLTRIPHPVVIFGDHTRNLKYVDHDFIAGADGTKVLAPFLSEPRYFYLYLSHFDLKGKGYARHFKILNENLIAIPPLSEQKRIVAKVDELMALCDQLEQRQEDSIETHETLVKSLLDALTTTADPAQFQQAWQRIEASFHLLFTTESSVDHLKQTILQLAVMGKLVPQDPNDEPASELLKRIAAEKAQLIKEKKIKKQKPLPPISEDEKPFTLPHGWEWCRLNDLSLSSIAGWSPRCEPSPREGENWGVLKVSAVTWGKFNPEENKELPVALDARPECEVKPGDFLISRANTADLVARAIVVPNDAPKHLMMSDKIIRFKFTDAISADYVNLVNNSAFSRQYYGEVAGGTSSSMKNVSRVQIQNLVIALPPYREELRIMKNVDSLMTLCDSLKAKLQSAQTTQQTLTDTIVEQAVES